jgi:Zn-dependent protease with chaperone function
MRKINTRQFAAITLALGLLSGCANAPRFAPPDQEALTAERKHMTHIALASWEAEQARLSAIRQRLWQTATARGQCKQTQPDRGAVLASLADLPSGLRAEVADTGERAPGLYIVAVAPGSPAADAGLRAGQRISAAGSAHRSVYDTPPAEWRTGDILSVDTIDADGMHTAQVSSTQLCAVELVMDDSHDLVAYYESGRIHIAQGMVQALPDDASLAFVVAHELGHATAGHSALSRFLDPTGSRDQESEADLLGIRLVAHAGYDITQVVDIWDQLAKLDPARISPGSRADHPLRAERKLRMQAAIAALQRHD